MKTILVTGGAGYIGSVLTEALIADGYAVTVLDNLSHGYPEAVHPDALFVQGDVGDYGALTKIFSGEKIDAVVHMAADIEVGESVEKPNQYFKNNVAQPLALLECMQQAGVKNFLFSSTAAVYGNPEKQPITEEDPTIPINPYGLSKLMFERVLDWNRQASGLQYACLRYFNASGATQKNTQRHEPFTHIIPLLTMAALGKRKAFTVYGADYPTPDGTCIRDYVHVLDIAAAHVLLLKKLESGEIFSGGDANKPGSETGFIYNIGNGRGFSVKEVINAYEKVLGRKIPVEYGARRAGDPPELVASSEKIRALGWEPKHSTLEEIIQSTWDWWQKRA